MTFMKARDSISGWLYTRLLKPVLFFFDPETVHNLFILFGRFLGSNLLTKKMVGAVFGYHDLSLEQKIAGLRFKNPIGLAAGFDKDGFLPGVLPEVGFGFEEIGSVTALPFGGNERPWLWRLPEQNSLRVNFGLKNQGAELISKRLSGRKFDLVLGVSLAKTNIEATSHLERGIADYFESYELFLEAADYFTINISCPNTCETFPIFAKPENLDLLLARLFSIPKSKPVFIKLSPDLAEPELDAILSLGKKYPVDGYICTNLTKVNAGGHLGKGGFSGKAVADLSDRMIAKVYKYFDGSKIIIGCGGIFSAEDAYKKIRLGASLLQLITGMVFMGPQLVGQINRGVAEFLRRDGYSSISQAVGTASD